MKKKIEIKNEGALDFLKSLRSNSVDLFLTSPPYCMGKEYESSNSVKDFVEQHQTLKPLLLRALKPTGSVCWQVGFHVDNGIATPLDSLVYSIFSASSDLILRNRIVWTFGHGVHARTRFSGRHETVLWFTRSDEYQFDLDAVRVPQKYPGKRHYKGPNRGKWSGNPLGKNPSDVWDIPNVKAGHLEKTEHPCQFPVALAQRLIRALTEQGQLVVDPFLGSGTTAIAAAIEGRRFKGCDLSSKYVRIAERRIDEFNRGTLRYREDIPVFVPTGNESVSKIPKHFESRKLKR